ncbi:MAG: rod shape-determining protein MreC [Cytophagaceae bacterium]
MQRLFEFLYQYRAFLFFVLLETISGWLIVKNNNYQSSAFFNSCNYYAASVLKTRTDIDDYFHLREVNRQMVQENARLNNALIIEKQKKNQLPEKRIDSTKIHQYEFIPAKVINVSWNRANNFITINKGIQDSIREDMGVISPQGLVGKVKKCSDHFSTVVSILNERNYVASKIKTKNINGSLKWGGTNPRIASLLNVPIHHTISKGDTVITSEHNSIYPEGIMIGIVQKAQVNERAEYEIEVLLSTDFSTLTYVYVINNKLKPEQDSLEQATVEGSDK